MGRQTHVFRHRDPSQRRIAEAVRAVSVREQSIFAEWSAEREERQAIEQAVADGLLGEFKLDRKLAARLAGAEKRAKARPLPVRDVQTFFNGAVSFAVGPGLNVLAPPYDWSVKATAGSEKPYVEAEMNSGRFGVVASCASGPSAYSSRDTAGFGGIALFIVPAKSSDTLSIRPYFEWRYRYGAKSHGTPTAHCRGYISASARGHRGNVVTDYPVKDKMLWTAGSSLWSDAEGDDSGTFWVPDATIEVSGHDYYSVTYACRASADSAHVRIGFWSEAFLALYCRVPFVFVEER